MREGVAERALEQVASEPEKGARRQEVVEEGDARPADTSDDLGAIRTWANRAFRHLAGIANMDRRVVARAAMFARARALQRFDRFWNPAERKKGQSEAVMGRGVIGLRGDRSFQVTDRIFVSASGRDDDAQVVDRRSVTG